MINHRSGCIGQVVSGRIDSVRYIIRRHREPKTASEDLAP